VWWIPRRVADFRLCGGFQGGWSILGGLDGFQGGWDINLARLVSIPDMLRYTGIEQLVMVTSISIPSWSCVNQLPVTPIANQLDIVSSRLSLDLSFGP